MFLCNFVVFSYGSVACSKNITSLRRTEGLEVWEERAVCYEAHAKEKNGLRVFTNRCVTYVWCLLKQHPRLSSGTIRKQEEV